MVKIRTLSLILWFCSICRITGFYLDERDSPIQHPQTRILALAQRPAYCPTNIAASIVLVNNYWQSFNANPPPGPNSLTWGNGTYFGGALFAYSATGVLTYWKYVLKWANSNQWSFAPHPPTNEADYLSVGYAYILLYLLDPKHPTSYLIPLDREIRGFVNSPRLDLWTWVDALHMVMPQFAYLGVMKKDPRYLEKMYQLFNYAKTQEGGGLWDPVKGLWWRDRNFVGRNIYWSRGNGWAIAALVKVLDILPSTDPHYQEYVSMLQQMAAALAACQQPNGFWYVNLGDPTNFPGGETSGTLFFVYGITWGIRNGLLNGATYGPIVAKAWNAVNRYTVDPSNGRLGYCQGPGYAPASRQPVTSASTYDYGFGAYLLAGAELVKLCGR
ncbi:hypothetical protein TWF696_004002 [Orbilia brochopaga]|uniref:Glycoside hydrolase family 88 protein n=1 Tax=Orbilia brochopaga TaxID=3140254 RepID=A0AAV9VBC7_9PEZI